MVRLKSRRGAVKVPVQVTDRVSGTQLYMPQHGKNNVEAINVLTSFQADKDTDTPAYKECAVNMQVLQDHGSAPLKPNNQRHKRRHPISGVQVNQKWQRDDYERPPNSRPAGSGI